MEELHSTEVLDREILEDARKKAFKILKTADDTVQSKDRSWERKTKRAIEGIRKTYAARTESLKEETLARLPLDKRRLRSETAETFLKEAMDAFLSGLGRDTLLSILEREFAERLEACREVFSEGEIPPEKAFKPVLSYSSLSAAEGAGILKNALKPGLGKIENSGGLEKAELIKDDSPEASKFPSVTLNTRAVRVKASVEGAAAELLKNRRAELAGALLGEGALND
jgi:hypothetical protein